MSPTLAADERILAAAAALFAEHGYRGTATSAIATRAGVNEVTLFRHFGSKEGVLRALGQQIEAARTSFPPPEVEDAGDPRATLRDLAADEIRDGIRSGGLAIRLSFDARSVPEVRAAMGDALSANLARLAAYLRPLQARGILRGDIDASLIAEAFYGLTSSLVMYRLALGRIDLPAGQDIERLADQVLDLFWSGAAAQDTRTGGS